MKEVKALEKVIAKMADQIKTQHEFGKLKIPPKKTAAQIRAEKQRL